MVASKRTIEVDDATATALESRAAETGLSVTQLVAELVAVVGTPAELSQAEVAELDRQWAEVRAGGPTVPHEDVVRWLDTWGSPGFRQWNSR